MIFCYIYLYLDWKYNIIQNHGMNVHFRHVSPSPANFTGQHSDLEVKRVSFQSKRFISRLTTNLGVYSSNAVKRSLWWQSSPKNPSSFSSQSSGMKGSVPVRFEIIESDNKHTSDFGLLGAIHKLRPQNFRDFGPPPPFCHAFTQPISSVCHILGNPPSPLSADVI